MAEGSGVVIEHDGKRWVGRVEGVPGVEAKARTREACLAKLLKALRKKRPKSS